MKENLLHKIFRKSQPVPQESIYFYSLHKAGTSLMTHALRQASNLKHVDYETMIFDNKLVEKPVFYDHGHLYGVVRVIQPGTSPIYTSLGQYVSTPKFVKDKTIVCMVRDPRDILISLYYSLRNSHVASANPEIQKTFQAQRDLLQNTSLGEFTLERTAIILTRFQILHELSQSCKQKVILKYEDLVNNFEGFMAGFEQYINIPRERKQELYLASRPLQEEDHAAHKRSGKIGQYKEKLTPAMQQKITAIFRPMLELFGYDASDIPLS